MALPDFRIIIVHSIAAVGMPVPSSYRVKVVRLLGSRRVASFLRLSRYLAMQLHLSVDGDNQNILDTR